VAVSDAIEELILGSDWLSGSGCVWDFGTGKLSLGGHTITMLKRQSKACVRRIYVAEDVVVPPFHQADIPVKLMMGNLHVPQTDWAIEPKTMKPGIVTARTLVNGALCKTIIHVLNYCDRPVKFAAETFVGSAEPVVVLEDGSGHVASEPSGDGPPERFRADGFDGSEQYGTGS
jgi:hypothetical protein